MHADREPARSRIDVVAADRALRFLVELPVGVQRQRMRRDDGTLAKLRENRCGKVVPLHDGSLSQFWPGEGKDMARIVEPRSAAKRHPHVAARADGTLPLQ